MAGFYGSSLICLLSFIMCVYKSNVVHASNKSDPLQTCAAVSKVFEKLNSTEGVPVSPITAPTLGVCSASLAFTGGKSCCTSGMETQFLLSGEEYLRQHLHKLNLKLLSRITYTQDKYLDLLKASLTEAENSTSEALERDFSIPKEVHGGNLYDLFAKFHQYLQGHSIVLEDVLSNFFEQLFPQVYKYEFLDKSKAHLYGNGIDNCLMDYSDEIKPFGKIPDILGKKIKRAFHRARVVMETMRVMHHVINFTNSFKVDNACRKAMARLRFCPWCAGSTETLPCRGLCLNVYRGCLSATVTDLAPHWDDLVMAFENLEVDNPKGKDFQDIIGVFSTNVSLAVMNAMTDMERIHEDVKSLCADYLKNTSSSASAKRYTSPEDGTRAARHRTTPSVRPELAELIKELDDSKGVFLRMADGVCRDPGIETDMDSDLCWNGTTTGRYGRLVPEASILTQARSNPEVRVNITVDRAVLHLKDRIDQTRRNLSKLLNEEKMQGDSTYADVAGGMADVAGSGQERGYSSVGGVTDDEDFSHRYDGSGDRFSGSGDDSDEEEMTPRPPDETGSTGPKITKRPIPPKKDSGGDQTSKPGDGQTGSGVAPLTAPSLLALLLLPLLNALIQSEC